MLARLRLDGFVGGDDKQDQVDAAHAGQHVLDEAFVTGHIHEAQPQRGRQLQVRETDIDGDAAALLFLQAIRIDTGEGLHQRSLAVIDVACRADDDVLHAPARYCRVRSPSPVDARCIASNCCSSIPVS